MPESRIGILHPGQMGIVAAISLKNSGNEVYWASEGRGSATRERAVNAGLKDVGTIAELCKLCDAIVSVCPPEFAEDLALQVARESFAGLYVDANAISPERTQRIARGLEEAGASFVDGGIIGPALLTPHRTWLYLSGERAGQAASYFAGGPMEAEVLTGGIGQASALKMCFAAYSKGSIAMLCATLAVARELDVLMALKRQWARNGPEWTEVEREISRAAPKAWRFGPEMEEIAHTFQCAGVPAGFHLAAAEVFRRLADFKDGAAPELKAVLEQLAGYAPHGRLPS